MSTCVAPGHPECKISCPKGCIAWYDEKYKRCVTRCSGKIEPFKFEYDSLISLSVTEFPAGELLQMLDSRVRVSEEDSKKLVSFSLESVSVQAIIEVVKSQLGPQKSSGR